MSHRKKKYFGKIWKHKLQAKGATAAKIIYFDVNDTLSQYTQARMHA